MLRVEQPAEMAEQLVDSIEQQQLAEIELVTIVEQVLPFSHLPWAWELAWPKKRVEYD